MIKSNRIKNVLVGAVLVITGFASNGVAGSVSENPVVGPRASGCLTGKDGEAGDIGGYRRYSRTQSSRTTSRSKPDRILRQAPKDKPLKIFILSGQSNMVGHARAHTMATILRT